MTQRQHMKAADRHQGNRLLYARRWGWGPGGDSEHVTMHLSVSKLG